MLRCKWIFGTLLVSIGSLFGQITPEQMETILTGDDKYGILTAGNRRGIVQFYAARDYYPVWFGSVDQKSSLNLLHLIQTSGKKGLEEVDYDPEYVGAFYKEQLTLINLQDSLLAELRLTTIALKFFGDFFYGNTIPEFGYDGLKYSRSGLNIPEMTARIIQETTSIDLKEYSPPAMPEIRSLIDKIEWMHRVISDTAFHDDPITSSNVGVTNKPLCKKLFLLGVIDSSQLSMKDLNVKEKLREVQRQFCLLPDGVLRNTALKELNVPLVIRLRQLNLAVNYYRWLYCLSFLEPVIVVNIPAAYLKVYDHGKVLLEMRTIVGKRSTPTPTLNSRINEVVLYPYWTVPYSIATKELLPLIKQNPGFIDANNYQVLNSRGKIMDPGSIDWTVLSVKNFPYVIRQSTGCDNALGLLKLDFYNPFSVYLHDTPDKSLFMLNKRYFSHGCMRLESPMKLGHLVLRDNFFAIDTLTEKGCLKNQAPVHVPADVKMAVVVWYNLVGVDSTGRVQYFEDVYKKMQWNRPVVGLKKQAFARQHLKK